MFLDLPYNQLDAADVTLFGSRVWPKLWSLSLSGNPFGHCGLLQLIKGNWPLTSLRVGLDTVERRDSALLLGLDPGKVQELRAGAHGSAARLQRALLLRGVVCGHTCIQ